ncbi:MAG: hypothetical protein AAB381_01780 [Patescibacteria group bacterium]
MTPEERSLLERTHKLAEENNALLRSMRRMSRISGALRILYWVVILGVGFGTFYVIQPYVESLLTVFGDIQAASGQSPGTASLFLDLLK